jgi:hypothetical protein
MYTELIGGGITVVVADRYTSDNTGNVHQYLALMLSNIRVPKQ